MAACDSSRKLVCVLYVCLVCVIWELPYAIRRGLQLRNNQDRFPRSFRSLVWPWTHAYPSPPQMFHTPWDAREERDRQAERKTESGRQRDRETERGNQKENKREKERRERKGVVEGDARGFKVTVYLRYVRAFWVWASERESERVTERVHKYAYHDTQTHILDRVFSRAETLYNQARRTCFCQCHLLIFRILHRVLAWYLILFLTWYLWL